MTETNNICYIDDREKKDMKILAGIVHDEVEITRLDIGDALMRGVVFEFKRPADFVGSIFSQHLFVQLANMTEHYQHAFLLISGSYVQTQLLYDARARVHNFDGVIASCIARGCTPIFTGAMETSLRLVDVISAKVTDGKVRDRPVKRVSMKDKQISIVCSLPGVSDGRAKALLEHFGTIENIITATEKELCEVNRIGPKIAKKIIKLNQKVYTHEM
jgi:ERCC4-type nuclease